MSGDVEKQLMESKLGRYSSDEEARNFVGPEEITVQITLCEYRSLVKTSATTQMQIDAANSDKYQRETEIKDLQKKVDELRTENSELKAQLYELTKADEPEEPDNDF